MQSIVHGHTREEQRTRARKEKPSWLERKRIINYNVQKERRKKTKEKRKELEWG